MLFPGHPNAGYSENAQYHGQSERDYPPNSVIMTRTKEPQFNYPNNLNLNLKSSILYLSVQCRAAWAVKYFKPCIPDSPQKSLHVCMNC